MKYFFCKSAIHVSIICHILFIFQGGGKILVLKKRYRNASAPLWPDKPDIVTDIKREESPEKRAASREKSVEIHERKEGSPAIDTPEPQSASSDGSFSFPPSKESSASASREGSQAKSAPHSRESSMPKEVSQPENVRPVPKPRKISRSSSREPEGSQKKNDSNSNKKTSDENVKPKSEENSAKSSKQNSRPLL